MNNSINSKISMDMDGKTAIVTGGSLGIGIISQLFWDPASRGHSILIGLIQADVCKLIE